MRVSGEELSDIFETWLFTTTKPVVPSATTSATSRASLGTVAVRYAADGKWRLNAGNR